LSHKKLHSVLHGRGSQTTLIFLHASGYDSRMWAKLIKSLDMYSCVAIDLPGHGQSRHIPFTTIEEAAGHVFATIQALGITGKECHVVVLSLGVYVGMSLIHQYQASLGKAILTGFNVAPIPGFFWMKLFGYFISPLTCTKWYRRLSEKAMEIPADSPMRNANEAAPMSSKTTRAVLRAVGRFAIPPQELPSIQTELLAVAGEKEHETLLNTLTFLPQKMPNCQSYKVARLGHAWPAQDPDLAIRLIRSWIDEAKLPN